MLWRTLREELAIYKISSGLFTRTAILSSMLILHAGGKAHAAD